VEGERRRETYRALMKKGEKKKEIPLNFIAALSKKMGREKKKRG